MEMNENDDITFFMNDLDVGGITNEEKLQALRELISDTPTTLQIEVLFNRLPPNDVVKENVLIDLLKLLTGMGKTELRKIKNNARTRRLDVDETDFGCEYRPPLFRIFDLRSGDLMKEIDVRYDITGRYFNLTNQSWYFSSRYAEDGTPAVLGATTIRSIIFEGGGTNTDVSKIMNYLTLSDEITDINTIRNYEYFEEDNTIKFPHEHVSVNAVGHGLEFFERYNSTNENLQEARDSYLNLLRSAENGIGKARATLISAFAIASPFQTYFKKKNRIVGQLHLLGKPDTAKSTAAELLGDICKYPILHNQNELTPAVFSQLGSAGSFPLLIDDVDKINIDIENTLKVILTGSGKRRRSNSDGSRRDNPEFVRTVISTANVLPKFISSTPAMMDRTILVEFTDIPTNEHAWKSACERFWACKTPVINYLIHSDVNFTDLITETETEVREMDSNRKKGIYTYVLMGMKLLEVMGHEIDDETRRDIKEIVLESNTRGLSDEISKIMDFLQICNKNRMHFKKESEKNDEANISSLNMLFRNPMVDQKFDESELNFGEYYVIPSKAVSAMNRELDLKIKNLKELQQLFDVSGLKTQYKRSRVEFYDSVIWTLWVKIEIPPLNEMSIEDLRIECRSRGILVRNNETREDLLRKLT